MLLSGQSKLYATEDGSGTDGFVMRVTPLGFVQWITYVNTNYKVDDQIVGAISVPTPGGTDQNIFAFYGSLTSVLAQKTNAVVKLSYLDGKLLWAKSVIF